MKKVFFIFIFLFLIIPLKKIKGAEYLNLQGMLRSFAGVPVSGKFSMRFSLWTEEIGGKEVWWEKINEVKVENGLFFVLLGETKSFGDVFENPVLYLEIKIGNDTPLNRKKLTSVAYAFRAKSADLAKNLDCKGCISPDKVNFPWAEADKAGGFALNALNVECSGCVESTDIKNDSISSSHIQNGGVTENDVNFNFAGANTKGGAAVDLQCSGCVSSTDIAPNISLTGDLSISGSLKTCTENSPQCHIALSSDGGFYEKNDGWINVQIKDGIRIRNQNDSEWRDLVARNITSYGNFNLYGNFLCTDCIGEKEVASGFYPGLDADLLDGKDSTAFASSLDALKIFSNTADVSDSSYLEVKHNGNTNDIMVTGWLLSNNIWKTIPFESSFTGYIAEEDLVGYWSFNDCNANDLSKYKNHGKLIANPSCVDGKHGKAFDFNGSQRIEINDNPSLNPPHISIVLWTYRKGFSGADNDILLNKEISPGYEIAVADNCWSHSGNFSYWFPDSPGGGCGGWNNGGFSVPANTWVHIAITNDNNYCKTYKNGSLIVTHNCPGSFDASPYCLLIGARGGCGSQSAPYIGIIDEVAIYERALSAKEIQSIYNNGIQKTVQAPYRIEQIDANNVRLYNNSGSTKKLKLVVIRK